MLRILSLGLLPLLPVLAASAFCVGCSASSIYKKAAKIGVELVGDAVTGDRVQKESGALLGQPTAEADRRHGNPRNAFEDARSGREVRVYGVNDDLLGRKRWVVESQGGRIDALSLVEVNPDLGKDEAKALLLEQALRGKTPDQVRQTPIAGRRMFDSPPRNMRRLPGGERVEVYNVTSFLEVTGSRFIALGYDAADRCQEVRFVGAP